MPSICRTCRKDNSGEDDSDCWGRYTYLRGCGTCIPKIGAMCEPAITPLPDLAGVDVDITRRNGTIVNARTTGIYGALPVAGNGQNLFLWMEVEYTVEGVYYTKNVPIEKIGAELRERTIAAFVTWKGLDPNVIDSKTGAFWLKF